MPLWKLEARTDLPKERDPWEMPHEKFHGFTVRAKNEKLARKMAQAEAKHEAFGEKVWLTPEFTTCTKLLNQGEPEIIMSDYLHG